MNKFKMMDKTKRIVLLFITISFVFILGISTYRTFHGDYSQKKNETTIVENKNEENQTAITDKNLENNQTQEVSQDKEQEDKKTQESIKDVNPKTSSTQQNISSSKENKTEKSNNQTEQPDKNNQETNISSEIKEDETKTIQIEVIGINETMMSGYLKLEEGNNAYTALKALSVEKNIKISTSGYGSMIYVRGIGDLFEKQHGSGSGWMYKVNDVSPNIGAGSYVLKDGDHVVWYYVYSE